MARCPVYTCTWFLKAVNLECAIQMLFQGDTLLAGMHIHTRLVYWSLSFSVYLFSVHSLPTPVSHTHLQYRHDPLSLSAAHSEPDDVHQRLYNYLTLTQSRWN